jgi:hypothetical protein
MIFQLVLFGFLIKQGQLEIDLTEKNKTFQSSEISKLLLKGKAKKD